MFEAMMSKPYNEEIESDELFKYNKAVQQLTIEARIDLSYFESELRKQKECEICYADNSIASPAFGWIQQLVFDHFTLSVCRLYETGQFNKNTYNINRLIEKSLLKKDDLQRYVNSYEMSGCGIVANKLEDFQKQIEKDTAIIEKIKNHRDKRLAHNEKNKSMLFFNEDNGISILHLKHLTNQALHITNYINCCFTNCALPYDIEGQIVIDGLKWFDGLFIATARGINSK